MLILPLGLNLACHVHCLSFKHQQSRHSLSCSPQNSGGVWDGQGHNSIRQVENSSSKWRHSQTSLLFVKFRFWGHIPQIVRTVWLNKQDNVLHSAVFSSICNAANCQAVVKSASLQIDGLSLNPWEIKKTYLMFISLLRHSKDDPRTKLHFLEFSFLDFSLFPISHSLSWQKTNSCNRNLNKTRTAFSLYTVGIFCC